MDAIDRALSAAYADSNIGVWITWQPAAGGPPAQLRALRRTPVDELQLGRAHMRPSGAAQRSASSFMVLAAAMDAAGLPPPAKDDRVTTGDGTAQVRSFDLDPIGRVWTITMGQVN
jgi:hypothetical protein